MATTVISTHLGARTRHRIALRLLPYLFFLYVIAFLDRMNISTAALEMPHDLGFSDRVLGLGSGIFFLGYILLEIPGSLIVERWSARRWIARIMFSWGLVTITMAFIRTPHQFYTVRFLLGLAEAGFFPGVIVYLTHWFIYEDRAKAVANFMAAIPLSYVLGSPISGWLLGVNWMGIRGWRWLFIVEGIPALVFGVVTWFYLTDRPREAKWLSPDERDWIARQLEQERQAKKAAHSYTIWQALCHRDVLILTAAYFVDNLAGFALSFWMPTMIKRVSGLANFPVALLVAVPYIVAVLAMQLNGWHSDRTAERRWHTAIPLLIAAAALLPLSLAELGTIPSVVLFAMAHAGLLAFVPSFWAMPSAFLSDTAAAVSTGAINCFAVGLGGFAGPALLGYLATRSNSFRSGFACLVAALVAAGLLTLTLRVRRPERVLTTA